MPFHIEEAELTPMYFNEWLHHLHVQYPYQVIIVRSQLQQILKVGNMRWNSITWWNPIIWWKAIIWCTWNISIWWKVTILWKDIINFYLNKYAISWYMMLFHHLTFLMMKTHLRTNCHNFDFFKLYYCPYLQFNFTFCIPPSPSHSLQFVQCAVLPGGPSHSPSPHASL